MSIHPNLMENIILFLTSSFGKYPTSLLCRETTCHAIDFGNNFCYIHVVDTSTWYRIWESMCNPVKSENACSVVFTKYKLQGDICIRDKDDELAWKTSQETQVAYANQDYSLPRFLRLAPALPPFAQPISGNKPGRRKAWLGGDTQDYYSMVDENFEL
ncbi:hypothetical protein ZIOFF_064855 [Zingiber officinale]|uniref:Uncharacterized protein n=1 Tax=Zingiber officinale TaxID=94328 RepID=A0A8J5EWK3_ZINOF|nr:hypothetical protein ZIOFF_064855 [Zingiber officinale]